jgi:transcriptional regulator with XRE-family HTH domain
MGGMASISNRVGDLGAYLREQRENARLSVRQLASLAGVSNPYLSQVERGLRHPSAEVLQQIAKGLRISAEALYVRAGILDENARGTLEAAIDADEGLTPRQKKVLRELCAHFRSENARVEGAPVAPVAPEVELEPVRADELIGEIEAVEALEAIEAVEAEAVEAEAVEAVGLVQAEDPGETPGTRRNRRPRRSRRTHQTGETGAAGDPDGETPATTTTDTVPDAR